MIRDASYALERYLHSYREAVRCAEREGVSERLKAHFLYTAAARMDWYLALAGLDDSMVSFLPFGVTAPVKGGRRWVVSIPIFPLDAALEDAGLPEPIYLDVLVTDRETLAQVAAGLVRSVGEGRVVGGEFLWPPEGEEARPLDFPILEIIRWLAGEACKRGPARMARDLTGAGVPVSTSVVQALKTLARAMREGAV